nr:MAG TPA: hypothetical protein [Caudoviricetes sp.]
MSKICSFSISRDNSRGVFLILDKISKLISGIFF